MSDQHARAIDTLNKRCTTLKIGDFKYSVKIHHQDGSTMWFENAFAEKFEEWWLVFTEHCGYHAFYADDLEFIRVYKKEMIKDQ